jgi:plasmid stabilization system protein ParE
VARKVRTAAQAAEGLAAARKWLLQPGSGADGRRRWENLRGVRRRLREFPYLGAPDRDNFGYYRLVASEHRIIYAVDPDTGDRDTAGDVLIVAVFGPGQP